MQKGSVVTRNSYGNDIFFRVAEISGNKYTLCGLDYRLHADAYRDDLVPVMLNRLLNFKQAFSNDIRTKIAAIKSSRGTPPETGFPVMPGRVLHVDADNEYLKICMNYYSDLEVPAFGENISEPNQPGSITELLKKYMPDILVITGHDSLSDTRDIGKVENYKNSAYFADAVKNARIFNPSKDSLIIIAGACQSHYETLINSGANIASSPQRVLIHALDPLLAAEKIAYASVDTMLRAEDILNNTITGVKGLGGYQTRGTLRQGLGV